MLQFRMGGRESKTRRYTIGSHGSPWTPATARAEAERLAILIAQGIDPGEAERQRRRESVDLAFDNYSDRFAEACVGEGWRRLVKRSLELHVKPVLGSKPFPTYAIDIVAVFDRMPRAQIANIRNVFAVLRRLCAGPSAGEISIGVRWKAGNPAPGQTSRSLAFRRGAWPHLDGGAKHAFLFRTHHPPSDRHRSATREVVAEGTQP
nr:integrase arm-type DNA-binding domain-containing protein [Sphingopyxis sp.]